MTVSSLSNIKAAVNNC